MSTAYITDVAAVLPNQPVGNDAIESVLGEINGKPSRARRIILRSNGIQHRHYAIDPATGLSTHTNAQLTAEAVRALTDSESVLANMDCLVCGTSLPDQLLPNHAVMVHGELANRACEVVATSGVCLAGMTALKYAFMGVACGEFTSAVATGSELASSVLRSHAFESEVEAKIEALDATPEIAFEKDFLRWMLSDGAGAVHVQSKPAAQGLSLRIDWLVIKSYANELDACMYSGAIKTDAGDLLGWKELPSEQWANDSVFAIKQDVKQLNENIVPYTVEKPLAEIVQQKNLNVDDIDYFLPHYSSGFFREKLSEGLKNINFDIPMKRWFTNLTSKGNTGSASIFIMLEELLHSNKLKSGQKILCYVPESGRFSTAFMLLTVCDSETNNEA